MADGAVVNRTQFSDAIKTEYETTLLTRAVANFPHARFAQKAIINKRGDYELRKYGSMSAVTSALSEGITPAQQSAPSLSLINIDPVYYGSWMRFTRELDLENFDPIVNEMSTILGEQAGLSVDTLVRNDIVDNATVDYPNTCSARSDIDVTDELITFSDFVNQVAELQAANGRPSDGGNFAVIMHPYSMAQLLKDTTFFTLFTRESNANGKLVNWSSGMFGSIFGCNIYSTSNARHYTSDVEVYTATFIGANSYGIVGVGSLMPNFGAIDNAGMGFQTRTGMRTSPVSIIMNPLGSQGDDPLHQRGSLAWVTAHAQSVLDATWIRRLEHAVEQSA